MIIKMEMSKSNTCLMCAVSFTESMRQKAQNIPKPKHCWTKWTLEPNYNEL